MTKVKPRIVKKARPKVPVNVKTEIPVLVRNLLREIIRTDLDDAIDSMNTPFSDFIEKICTSASATEITGKIWDIHVTFARTHLVACYGLNSRYACKIVVPFEEARPLASAVCNALFSAPKKVVSIA